MKTAREAVRKQEWYPEASRDGLTQVENALLLSKQARQSGDPNEAYATFIEALIRCNAASEWHLSRDLIRETDAKFQLPPDALKKWYQDSIRKTESGGRLAELVDLFATDALKNELPGEPESWESVHRQLTNRLEESQHSATLFSCRERLRQAGDRLDLRQKDPTKFWQGITAIVDANDVPAGIKQLTTALDATVAQAATGMSGKDFSFEECEKLLRALADKKDPNTREAAILIFRSVLDKLTNEQIVRLQDVCYSLNHKLTADLSLPYYDHGQDPGKAVRMHVLKVTRGRRNIRFNEDEASWSVNETSWIDYVQMPVTCTVHDIEFSAEQILRFFKFRYGAHNSLRVGFEQVAKDRFRLKHQHSYGRQAKSKRSRDTFAYGDRIKLRVYTLCGRQYVVINGKYMTERVIDNVWTSHQFVAEPETKLTLYKSTLRGWLAGDTQLFRATVGEKAWLRCTRERSTDWNRDELSRLVRENIGLDRKPTLDAPFVNDVGVAMQPISPGQFQHGTNTFKLTNKFWVSKYEISQLQWEQLMGSNPASIQGNAHFPVDNISYQDAIKFCKRLNTAAKKKRALPKGYAYRLLTEAEWEYVCRAGETDPFSVEADGYWHLETAQPRYHMIGTGSPNAFGVYDMHGNVEEITLDQYVEMPSNSNAVQVDPSNPPDEKDDHISIRGGSWCVSSVSCQSDRRKTGLMERCPYRGLRVALAPIPEK